MSNNNKTPLTLFTLMARITNLGALLFFTFFLASCSSVGVKSDKAANVNADLGIRYLQAGRLNLANEKLLKALKQNPNSPTANHYFAILQQNKKILFIFFSSLYAISRGVKPQFEYSFSLLLIMYLYRSC